jgi:hypothetical protein
MTSLGFSCEAGSEPEFNGEQEFRPVLGPTQPPMQWVPGPLSPTIKRPGREDDHSPPTSAEVKNKWIYTSTPLYVFMT